MKIGILAGYNSEVFETVLWLILLSAFPLTCHAEPRWDQVNSSSVELQRDLSELRSLRQSGDLDSFERIVNHDSVKWRNRDQRQFVKYMFEACSILSSHDIGDISKRALLLSQYASSVLEGGNLTMEENIQFVEFLTLDPPVIDESAWTSLREQKARFWLVAWRRVATSLDPTFDFNDRPYIEVPTPRGSGVPAGSSPESIKDKGLRAEYERAIAENSTKSLRYNEQYYLKQNAPRFYNEAERYLASAYARSPADLPGLERLLSEYIGDPVVRKRLSNEVRKNER